MHPGQNGPHHYGSGQPGNYPGPNPGGRPNQNPGQPNHIPGQPNHNPGQRQGCPPYAPQGGYQQGQPNAPRQAYYPQQPPVKSGNGSTGLLIGIVVAALVILGAGCWWYFGYRDTHPIVTDDIDIEEITDSEYSDGIPGGEANGISAATEAPAQGGIAQVATVGNTAATSSPAATSADTRESVSLFNRPLTYTGTVTPGGVATLNMILFQNGRLEGTIEYSGGKTMPLFGSYTWADDGHRMNINFTVSSDSDKTYSESWMGTSSTIKDDLAHTLTFKRINTSKGESMTASFALRP